MPGQPPIGPFGQQQQQPARVNAFAPSPVSAPKTAAELPISDNAQSKPASVTSPPAATADASQGGPPPPIETKPNVPENTALETSAPAQSATPKDETVATATVAATVPAKVAPTGPKNDRIPPAIPIAKPATTTGIAVSNGHPPAAAQSAITDASRAASAAVAAAMAKLPQPDGQQPRGPRADVDTATRKMGEFRPFDNNRPQRGGYRGRGGYYRNQNQGGGKKLEVPTTDYDFESANAKFNKQDLVKEAIASGSPLAESEENAPSETVDTVAEGSASSQAASNIAGYNKSSSFFDNISSEARDRDEAGASNPREWRGEEEKRNLETFGQGSIDGYRSNFRGRGRGRGYGRGRGGWHSRGYGGRGRGYGGRGRGQFPGSTGVPAWS